MVATTGVTSGGIVRQPPCCDDQRGPSMTVITGTAVTPIAGDRGSRGRSRPWSARDSRIHRSL